MQEPFKLNILDVEKKPIGITIPLAESSTSFFAQTYSTADQYKTNILNLIMTSKGERRMVPTYGSNLKRRIFEQDSPNFVNLLRSDIETAFEEWMPEVKIKSIEVYKNNENEHAFLLKLLYTLPFDVKTIQQVNLELA